MTGAMISGSGIVYIQCDASRAEVVQPKRVISTSTKKSKAGAALLSKFVFAEDPFECPEAVFESPELSLKLFQSINVMLSLEYVRNEYYTFAEPTAMTAAFCELKLPQADTPPPLLAALTPVSYASIVSNVMTSCAQVFAERHAMLKGAALEVIGAALKTTLQLQSTRVLSGKASGGMMQLVFQAILNADVPLFELPLDTRALVTLVLAPPLGPRIYVDAENIARALRIVARQVLHHSWRAERSELTRKMRPENLALLLSAWASVVHEEASRLARQLLYAVRDLQEVADARVFLQLIGCAVRFALGERSSAAKQPLPRKPVLEAAPSFCGLAALHPLDLGLVLSERGTAEGIPFATLDVLCVAFEKVKRVPDASAPKRRGGNSKSIFTLAFATPSIKAIAEQLRREVPFQRNSVLTPFLIRCPCSREGAAVLAFLAMRSDTFVARLDTDPLFWKKAIFLQSERLSDSFVINTTGRQPTSSRKLVVSFPDASCWPEPDTSHVSEQLGPICSGLVASVRLRPTLIALRAIAAFAATRGDLFDDLPLFNEKCFCFDVPAAGTVQPPLIFNELAFFAFKASLFSLAAPPDKADPGSCIILLSRMFEAQPLACIQAFPGVVQLASRLLAQVTRPVPLNICFHASRVVSGVEALAALANSLEYLSELSLLSARDSLYVTCAIANASFSCVRAHVPIPVELAARLIAQLPAGHPPECGAEHAQKECMSIVKSLMRVLPMPNGGAPLLEKALNALLARATQQLLEPEVPSVSLLSFLVAALGALAGPLSYKKWPALYVFSSLGMVMCKFRVETRGLVASQNSQQPLTQSQMSERKYLGLKHNAGCFLEAAVRGWAALAAQCAELLMDPQTVSVLARYTDFLLNTLKAVDADIRFLQNRGKLAALHGYNFARARQNVSCAHS
eukprot:gnl/Chilomastix_cuspidata/5200.p1 GENE.gnl/Chilomastix_cuspidata/5200~~gnl/Chilomastix_cuspidata/5200.p1  ORF type:complete len:913 (+),score=206.09 gnl/Chilomastix_cuspidata/5200:140-2878(+)